MAANYPASAPALGNTYADATVQATNHAAAHNAADDEINAIGSDLVAASQGAGSLDALVKARDLKASVRVASTANVTISPGGTSLVMDGVTLVNGDRVFLKDQTTPAQNGIYIVGGVGTSVTLTRSSDANTAPYMSDATLIMVEQGAAGGDTAWELVSDNPITLGTTPLYWTRAWPPYAENGPRNPWSPPGAVCQNYARDRWVANTTLPTLATWVFFGGGVLPAGRPVNNIVVYWTTAGAAFTIRHWSLVRASDLTVLQRTANATSTPTAAAFLTAALQAAYTAPVDTPIYLVLGLAAGTAPGAAFAAPAASVNITGGAPAIAYNSSTPPPTTTPPAVGAVLPAAGTGTLMQNAAGYYLT
jgi:hypothetical protein